MGPRAGRKIFGKEKNRLHWLGTRTQDIPACSLFPIPITISRFPTECGTYIYHRASKLVTSRPRPLLILLLRCHVDLLLCIFSLTLALQIKSAVPYSCVGVSCKNMWGVDKEAQLRCVLHFAITLTLVQGYK